MLGTNVAATAVTTRLLPHHPQAARAIAQLVGIGIATELARHSRGRRNPGYVQRAGYWLQRRITPCEPTQEQLAVAVAARDAVVRLEPVGPTPAPGR